MNTMATFGFMLGVLCLMFILMYQPGNGADAKGMAQATAFVIYRNAVNDAALANKVSGSIANSALKLPGGIQMRNWKNMVVMGDDGIFRCYVYGPGTPEEALAVQSLLLGSAAVGWNNLGTLVRYGDPLPLPSFIPDKNIVSVIMLD